MENPQYDKDFYEFFASLINDDEEVDLLRKILEGKDVESIVKEYIQTLGEMSDDQN
jgi:hypothetical protein